MADTALLSLPLLAASQSQKHVTHNEALLKLDSLVQAAVAERRAAAPATPVEGERHLVRAPATGVFAGRENELARFQDGGWRFFAPRAGWVVWIASENRLAAFDGAVWRDPPARFAETFGVNATPDASNRLAVASANALFTHDGADMRVKVNKAAPAACASLLYQSAWSGRAEIGLAGSDDLSVKVSADGAQWRESMAVDRASGAARFPCGVEHTETRKPLRGLIMTPGGDGQVSIFRCDATRTATPRTATVAAISGNILTLTSAVAGLFFHAYMQGVSMVRLWNTTVGTSCWVKGLLGADRLQVVDPASLAGWSAGHMVQLGDPAPAVTPTRAFAIDISPMMQMVLGAVFPQQGVLLKAGVSGVGGRVSLLASANGAAGSFNGVNSLSNGLINSGVIVVPCTVPSPISASNLIFLREDDIGPNTLGLMLASCLALLA